MFSGNFDYIRDGANQALDRLVRYLMDAGGIVRVYSPTLPPSSPTGRPEYLVSVPSIAIPGRPEYRLALGLPEAIQEDIRRFAPTVIHLSAPDLLGWRARSLARRLGVPVVASLHTRFETYLAYYGLGFLRPAVERYLASFYAGCDYVLAPNEPLATDLRRSGLGGKVRIWSRGVDHRLFASARRDPEWRRAHGYADDETVILFFGRLVLEKGLDTFAAIIAALRARGYPVRPLVVGTGPAGRSFARRLGDAVFTGHLEGMALGRAVASADILVNPSVTEAFGNVNLEGMAAGLAVVSADVPSAQALIDNGSTGLLVPPRDVCAYADAIEGLIREPSRRRALAAAATIRSNACDWPATLESVLDTYRLAMATDTEERTVPDARHHAGIALRAISR